MNHFDALEESSCFATGQLLGTVFTVLFYGKTPDQGGKGLKEIYHTCIAISQCQQLSECDVSLSLLLFV